MGQFLESFIRLDGGLLCCRLYKLPGAVVWEARINVSTMDSLLESLVAKIRNHVDLSLT